MKDDVLPHVNSLDVVFLSSTNLLCEFHIYKNVIAKCKILVTKAEDWEVVMDDWPGLLNSIDEQIYEQ